MLPHLLQLFDDRFEALDLAVAMIHILAHCRHAQT
jgi:hypothetical protein